MKSRTIEFEPRRHTLAEDRCNVVEQVKRRLRESHYLALRRLTCDFRDGVLTICGRVPTYHTKQIVLALVCTINGITNIEDRVAVDFESRR